MTPRTIVVLVGRHDKQFLSEEKRCFQEKKRDNLSVSTTKLHFFLHYMNIEIFDIGINKFPRTAATKQRHIFLFYATPFFENVL